MMLSLIARAIEFTTYSLVIKAVDKISKLPRNSQPSDLERLYRENLALKAQLETVKREIKIKIGKRPPMSVRTRAAQVFAYLLNRGNKPFIKYYLSASRPTVKTWATRFRRVESPGGISPPGAHRTGREPLDSSGSYHPAVRGFAPAAHRVIRSGERRATLSSQRDALRLRL